MGPGPVPVGSDIEDEEETPEQRGDRLFFHAFLSRTVVIGGGLTFGGEIHSIFGIFLRENSCSGFCHVFVCDCVHAALMFATDQ